MVWHPEKVSTNTTNNLFPVFLPDKGRKHCYCSASALVLLYMKCTLFPAVPFRSEFSASAGTAAAGFAAAASTAGRATLDLPAGRCLMGKTIRFFRQLKCVRNIGISCHLFRHRIHLLPYHGNNDPCNKQGQSHHNKARNQCAGAYRLSAIFSSRIFSFSLRSSAESVT